MNHFQAEPCRADTARRYKFSSLVPKLCLGIENYVSKLSSDSKFRSQVQPGNEDKNGFCKRLNLFFLFFFTEN